MYVNKDIVIHLNNFFDKALYKKIRGNTNFSGGSAKSSRPESQQEQNVEEERVIFSSYISLKDMSFSSQPGLFTHLLDSS